MTHIIIDNDEAYELARKLAEENGTSIATEVLVALQERNSRRPKPPDSREGIARQLIELAKTSSAHFKGDDRTRDLTSDLYDEDGLPR